MPRREHEPTSGTEDPRGRPGEGSPTPARRRKGLSRSLRSIAGFLVLALVLQYLVLPQLSLASSDIDDVTDRIRPWLLVAGAVLQVAAYLSHAQLTRAVLPEAHRPGLGAMTRIELASRAISHVVPGGTAAGTALGFRLMRQRGVPPADAVFAAATQGIGAAVVLNVMLWLALVVSIPLRGWNPYYGVVAGLGVLLLAAFSVLVLLIARKGTDADNVVGRVLGRIPLVDPTAAMRFVHRVAERLRELAADPPLLRRAVGWAGVHWAFDAASLWVFLAAFEQFLPADALFVAFGIANVLAAVPITPRGLGVVEAWLQTSLVGFGVPVAIAALSIAAYRLVNFWLPIPIGALSYLSLRLRREEQRPAEALTVWIEEAAGQAESAREWAARHGLRGPGRPPP